MAKSTAKKSRTTKKPESQPAASAQSETAGESSVAAVGESSVKRVGKKRGPYNVQRIEKKAATFRLPPDVIEYIDRARDEAAVRGDRLTKDEAVTMAVRSFWGGRRQRRS